MIDALLAILGDWSRLAQAMPWRSGLIATASALAIIAFVGAVSRARFEERTLRVSTGPLFALAGLVVLALALVVAIVDALLAWSGAMLIEERALLLLAPGDGAAAYEALRNQLALAQGGRFILPGPVHLPLSLMFGAAIYLALVWWGARTLEELTSLEQKPDDVLLRERMEQAKAIKKALEEGRPPPAQPVETVPLADDLFGRTFKLLGHWTSVELVEARFVRWQRPLVAALSGLVALALPAALGGHLSAPIWVGAAIALDGLRRNLATRTANPDKPAPPPAKEAPAPRPPLRPLVEAIHRSGGPLLLPPAVPEASPAQISPGTELRAKRILEDLSRELGVAGGLYVHQGLACDAFAARQNVLLCTPPLSGKETLLELLVFYALLVEAENVLWLATDAAAARAAERRFLERAEAARWKWNIHASSLCAGAGAVDPAHALPQLVFADPEGLHRELCGRQREWRGYLGGLGLVVIPDLEAFHGVRGAHLAHLLRRLRRAVVRSAPASPRALARGERLRFLSTADPSFRDLGRFAERLAGRPFLLLGPEVDGAPCPPVAAYFLPPAAGVESDLHPAVRALGEALSQGFSAELFGYEDALSRSEVAKANELMMSRGVATRGRAFAGERDEVARALAGAEVVIARVQADRYASLELLASHLGFRAGTVPEARLASLGAGERVGKAIAPPKPKEEPPAPAPGSEPAGEVSEEALAAADLERKVLLLWQPDLDPFSALLARERPPWKHPDLALGSALVADPLAEAIQRAHLHAALAEGELGEEELSQDFSRTLVESELQRLRGLAGEGARLVTRARVTLDPATGALREGPVHSLVDGEAHAAVLLDAAGEPARVCDRHTGEALFGVERSRMLAAAYPGRIFVHRGGRHSVMPLEEQDGLAAGRIACEREERALATSPIRAFVVNAVERRKGERREGEREGEAKERRADPMRSLGGAPFLLEHRTVDVEESVLGLRRHGPDGRERDVAMYADPIHCRYATRAAVLGLPADAFGAIGQGTLHALAHLFRVTLPAFVHHREEDLAVVRIERFGAAGAPAIAFVDLHPGGVGFSEAVTLDVLRMAAGWSLAIAERCPARCAEAAGCPRCLRIVQCHATPGDAAVLEKAGAREVLGKMLGRAGGAGRARS
ncbi:Zn-binding domain-containing protein [Polyangium aurulentum]|uniref:Zn-binding domain-containing protein n=1 Tax=Polyangium aurulentum TaxID=2567896 RepID=UPI0010AE0B62|nr:Zn-binding domain-containing protein [Polyangium aurulentum]UQA59045.1 DUF1998 domain-containing protein [Polyangium aurulentum]